MRLDSRVGSQRRQKELLDGKALIEIDQTNTFKVDELSEYEKEENQERSKEIDKELTVLKRQSNSWAIKDVNVKILGYASELHLLTPAFEYPPPRYTMCEAS